MAMIRQDGTLEWIIPADINLPGVLESTPPDGFTPVLDHLYHILDYVSAQMEFQDLDETNGFINLNAQKLQSYNKQYKKYLNYLVQCGILHSDNLFIKGKKSRGFAIRETFVSDAVAEVPVTRYTLRKRIKAELRQIREGQSHCRAGYGYLTKWFNDSLQIDEESAFEKIEELMPPPPTKGLRFGGKGSNRRSKRYKAVQAVRKLAEKQYYYSVDDTVGRFHTNLTNVKKELRPFITYDGQRLVNIDIACAQPLFSAALLNEDFWRGRLPLSIHNLPSIHHLYPSTTTLTTFLPVILPYITLDKSAESLAEREFWEYSTSVQNGTFYQEAYQKLFPGKAFNKKKIKVAIFQTFFSNNRFIGQWSALPKKRFSLAYPSVYRVFQRLKRDNHVILAHLLQRIESTIMIETVARRIGTERPDLPIFTIHDSILTTAGNEQYVKAVVEEEIYRLLQLKCKVTIES